MLEEYKNLPEKPFFQLFEESNNLFKDADKVKIHKDADVADGMTKLKIKTSGDVVILSDEKAAMLIKKGIAAPPEVKKVTIKEPYEEKYERFMEIAGALKVNALRGDKNSLQMLVALLANKFQLANDKPTSKSYIARQTLMDYKGSELLYLVVKLLFSQYKMVPLIKGNIGQKSKCDALNPHYEAKAREIFKLRIPATFRREYVEKYEGRIVKSCRRFEISKELNVLNRPSESGYVPDQKRLDELNSSFEELDKEIKLVDEELHQIDLRVKMEMALLKRMKKEFPGNDMLLNDLDRSYEIDYFDERDKYIESRKAKAEEENKFFSSPEDVLSKYKNALCKENILKGMEADKLAETAGEMLENFFLFGKTAENILSFLHSMIEGCQDEMALVAIIDSIGKLLSAREKLQSSEGFSEGVYNQVWDGTGTLLYVIVREGKGLARIHAYAAIARVGHLHKFEVEKLWYEDFLRAFKYESSILKTDPFFAEFKNGMMEGAQRLAKINTQLFQMKKKSLHNEIVKQINIAGKKNDKLVEEVYRGLAASI